MGQVHLAPKTLRHIRCEGSGPLGFRGSGPGHGGVGVLGCLLLANRTWASQANRLGSIAKLTLTTSIKPHFMEAGTSL